jgi:hypothetical protein
VGAVVKSKIGISFLVGCLALLVFGGCGGAGARHTYIVRPSVDGVPIAAYITIVSPVAFPRSLLDREKNGATFVHHAVGPQVCSFSKKMAGARGKDAFLNGKPVTLKVNGSNRQVTSVVCSSLQKQAFNPVPSQGLQPASP